MEAVLVTAKCEVVIPRRLCAALGLKPGLKVQAVQYGDRVELIPLLPLASARGVLDGADVRVFNDLATLVLPARIDPSVRPGVVSIPKGLWRKHLPGGLTANALTPADDRNAKTNGDHAYWLGELTPRATGRMLAAIERQFTELTTQLADLTAKRRQLEAGVRTLPWTGMPMIVAPIAGPVLGGTYMSEGPGYALSKWLTLNRPMPPLAPAYAPLLFQ